MSLSGLHGLSEHDAGDGDDVEAFEGCPEMFVVLDEMSSALCSPCQGALHDPAPWQKHEAALGLGQVHELQCDAVRARRITGSTSG